MIKSLTDSHQGILRGLTAGLFALMLAVFAMPAQAQMEDGELPKIDFSVNLAQHAQYISLDVPNADTDPIAGFQRVRAGVNASVQFADGVSGLLMIEQEPNDFGAQFAPAVDFAILNVQAGDALTIQTGTPVTGLMNFRGFSDGPAVQGNPLIGNSPADMITAGQGVKLIGSYDTFGFDLTVNKGFGGNLTSASGQNTGLELIGKARYTGSDMFKFGAGVAIPTGNESLNFANGDGENIHIHPNGQVQAVRNTQAGIPGGGFITHADAKIMTGGADVDAWVGYASDSDAANEPAAAFGGLGVKFDVNESFYVAGRFAAVADQSDQTPDSSTLTRFEGGIGYSIADPALLKISGVFQSHGDAGLTRPESADSFAGVLTELSFNF
jgi:hypothetical protein